MKTKADSDVVAAANCGDHHWEASIDSPTTLVCKHCPWRLQVTEDNLSVVVSFATPTNLFNYGIWLYGVSLFDRELAWLLINTAIAIALHRLPPEEFEELKAINREGTHAEIGTDLSQYCFEDDVQSEKIADLSTFYWHTWRVVGNLVKQDSQDEAHDHE